MQRKEGIALRAGRWSAKHRKTAIIGWLAFVVIALFAGQSIGMQAATDADTGTGESGRVDKIVDEGWKDSKDNATETVIIQSGKGLTVKDPSFRDTVRDVEKAVAGTPNVVKVKSPLDGKAPLSKDGRTALVEFEVKATEETLTENAQPATDAVTAQSKSHPGFDIQQFGGASAGTQIDERIASDFKKAEFMSIPITLVILVFAFGAIVAAGIPVLLALSAVIAAIGLVALPSQLVPMEDSVTSVILLIGMAVGIDYSLFYVKREREERERGLSSEAALEAAAATSGRAVLISGVTVLIAMAGMFMMGDNTFFGFAIATMIVVAIAMIGSVTVLPALLSKLGDRINKGRLPWVRRRQKKGIEEGRMWSAIVDRVLKRPVFSAVAATAVLVALSLPALNMKLAESGTDGLPQDLPVMKAYNKIQKAFPGKELPATVVVQADNVNAPQVKEEIGNLVTKADASDRFGDGIGVEVSPDRTVATIDIPVPGNGTDANSEAAINELRDEIVPTTVGKLPNAEVGTTGYTAGSMDATAKQKSSAPLVFAFVLGFAFLLLLVTFRSIVIPIKAIVLNLLSVTSAYGVLVLVFQNSWAEGLLNFKSTGTIVAWLPLFLFVILFGLSMDYHVFILSRIKEAFDKGATTDEAISTGIKKTAGVVTSAAIVMVAVFGIFATLSLVDLKMMGVGLAVAVLIDATIVRAVLLPATMKLLGDKNWYLPRSLNWLPKVRGEGEAAPAAA